MAAKAPITCHILDTSLGRPAANVRVRLEHVPRALAQTAFLFEAQTDDDGRIAAWQPSGSPTSPPGGKEAPAYTVEGVLGGTRGPSRWTLRFDTGAYYAASGRDTFFPEVLVVFEVAEGQRYHVPLLLAPFGYSTYRGS